MAKKKAAPPPEEGQDHVETMESIIAELPEGGGEDKAKRVLDELKAKSSEIVIRSLLEKPLPEINGAALRDRLTETVGLDGWTVDFSEIRSGILCVLGLRVGGEWNYKSGVGVSAEDEDSPIALIDATESAFRNACVLFGVSKGSHPAGRHGKPKAEPEPVAAAATPAPKPPETPMAPKVAAAVDKSKKLADIKQFCTAKIAECATPEDLNKMLRSQPFKAIPHEFKQDAFAHIKEQAGEVGWAFDAKSVEFYQPSPVGNDDPDYIPF